MPTRLRCTRALRPALGLQVVMPNITVTKLEKFVQELIESRCARWARCARCACRPHSAIHPAQRRRSPAPSHSAPCCAVAAGNRACQRSVAPHGSLMDNPPGLAGHPCAQGALRAGGGNEGGARCQTGAWGGCVSGRRAAPARWGAVAASGAEPPPLAALPGPLACICAHGHSTQHVQVLGVGSPYLPPPTPRIPLPPTFFPT